MNTASTSTPPTSPAIAKARLLQLALNEAAKLRLSTTAVAVLAHLIADAWPRDDGWTTDTPQSTLATKLGVNVGTIRRAVAELVAIVDHRPGQGGRRSRYILRLPNPAPAQGLSLHERRDPPGAGAGTSLHGRRVQPCAGAGTFQVQEIPSSRSNDATPELNASGVRDDAAPAAVRSLLHSSVGELPPAIVQERVRFLQRRPDWLPELKPWIDSKRVQELARSPLITESIVTQVLREARDSRHTLENPAGWIVKQLRERSEAAP